MANSELQIKPTLFTAKDPDETIIIGQQIAAQLAFPSCVYLHGSMGAGKTTLTKSIIKAFGYSGEVTSPTYNLVQEYQVEQGTIYHMDLYRLDDPSELEYLALQDLWSDTSLFLIEWPERGEGYLQAANIEITINKTFESPLDHRSIVLNVLDLC